MKTFFAAAILACWTSASGYAVDDMPQAVAEALGIVETLYDRVGSPPSLVLASETLVVPEATFSFRIGGRLQDAEILGESVQIEGDRLLRFRVVGTPSNSMITVRGRLAAGEISTPEGVFYLHPAPGGHRLERVVEFPCEVMTRDRHASASTGTGSKKRRSVRHPLPEGVVEIGFLPTYTSRFAEDRGGEEGALLEFRNAVNALNEGLRATGETKTVVVMRGAYRVDDSYLGVQSHEQALNKLSADDNIQRTRFESQAGIVMHFDIIAEGGGLAFLLDYPEYPWWRNGFAVIDWRPGFSIPRTVQHEFGHAAFGLHHDRPHALPSACPYCYAWGTCEAGLKDRMGSVSCWAEELEGYSGLSRYHSGIRVGSEESDALRRILETRFVAARLWQYAFAP